MRGAQDVKTAENAEIAEGRPFRGFRAACGSLLLIAACAALAGCGFAPLYGQPGVASNLSSIDVVAPQGRTGFLIRQHLDDAFAKDRSATPAYQVHLALAETRYPRGVRVDNVATRYEYVLTASYALTTH